MLTDHIDAPTARGLLERLPVLGEALSWVRALSADAPEGITELRGPELYVNVHGYDTLPREACAWESHRRTVDLQVCLAGGELIDYAAPAATALAGAYDRTKDFQVRRLTGPVSATVRLEPGRFALFLTGEPHQPKIADGVNPAVRKVVVKIAAHLLAV